MNFKKYFVYRFKDWLPNLKSYFTLVIPMVIVALLSRILDFSSIRIIHGNDMISSLELITSLGLDFLLFLAISGLFLIPFLALSFFGKIFTRIIFLILFSVLVIVNIALILYFSQTLVPLDQVIFIYKFSNILSIASAAGGSSFAVLLPIVLGLVFYLGLVFIFSNIQISKRLIKVFGVLVILIGTSTNLYIISPKQFESELSYFCNSNKLIYFSKAIIRYSKVESTVDIDNFEKLAEAYQSLDFADRSYLGTSFPFLYKNVEKSNLKPFFNTTEDGAKPNVVFIIVESLCNAVSGKNSSNHSFTPFLDSLTEQSLHWRNAISTSERTFGVLPAVLASLPPGEKGFVEFVEKYPLFYSLPKMLKDNSYNTQMFYGGWPGFTLMDKFVYASGIDSIYSKFVGYNKMPTVEDDFTWGYGDEVLFTASFPYINSKNPYFSLYLTLSTHSPFVINNQEDYVEKTTEIINSISDEDIRNYAHKHIRDFSTFIMFDDELRKFFDTYKKRPEYNNTIFVITGDHHGMLFKDKNNIDKYYVPLIIYSPLLVQSQEFGGVVSHNDIMPSLVSLLQQTYSLSMPSYGHAIGCELDTSVNFSANNKVFPMRNSREIDEYLYGEYYLSKGNLYKVYDNLELKLIDDSALKNVLENEIELFNSLQIISIRNNLLISPQLINMKN